MTTTPKQRAVLCPLLSCGAALRVLLLCLALEKTPSGLAAQSAPASLEIRLHSGLTITGAVGSVYAIEYTTSPAVKTSWRCLSFLQLSTPTHLWTDPTPATGPQRFYRATLDVRPNLVFIPPGSFRMGSPSNEVGRLPDEGPQTVVTLTQGFYMARYKVTQTDYQWVVGSYPSVFTGDFNRPVETVSWEDATNYCALLTRRERAARVIPPNCVYRLPTEAEWEYACRAWTTTRFSYGDDPGYTNLANYAWYVSNSGHTTRAVGEKLPNPWGLYDMHGGLWEWCQDWYGPYPGGQVTNPQGPTSGTYRVYRGGSWGCRPEKCRSAIREANPEGETGYVGFRVVLALAGP
ncbi:MAG: formylglycine-generating enzyme family protein [Verrucomicrobiales bacterium]|nr:formylglycine-generating enzyme family protein [Verrucomicrobiales bacterium]